MALFEIWYMEHPRPANERLLVSRNKREGWYRGIVREKIMPVRLEWYSFECYKEKGRHRRTKDKEQRLGFSSFTALDEYLLPTPVRQQGVIVHIESGRFIVSPILPV